MTADETTTVDAANPLHTVTLCGPDSYGAGCGDGHPKVELLGPDSCAECWGEDEIGMAFCPVCEFCCGC